MAIKMSVIVAVYNPGPHMTDLLTSLDRQTMPQREFETIFVDDDSSDGTRSMLTEFARTRENVHVLHNAPNSGWPGKPRNLGIAAAQGTYVFVVDHDDWLAPDALTDLWTYAEAHGSDVVIPKEIGHGHPIALSAFRRTIPRAVLGQDPVLHVPTPHKVFRRQFLEQHGLRFPEGRVRLEDLLFIVQAYLVASVISIYSDRTCYHWVHRDRSNASLQPVDPTSYYRDFERVLDAVAEHVEDGPLRRTLFVHWYQRILVGRLGGASFVNATPDYQRSLFAQVHRLMDERLDPALDDLLPPSVRPRAELARRNDVAGIVSLARAEMGITARVSLTQLRWVGHQLQLTVSATLMRTADEPLQFTQTADGAVYRIAPEGITSQLSRETLDCTRWLTGTESGLFVRDRLAQEFVELPVDASFTLAPAGAYRVVQCRVTATFDPTDLFPTQPAICDVYFRLETCGWRSQRRVPFDAVLAGTEYMSHRAGGVITTAYGTQGPSNLSIKRSDEPPPPERARETPPASNDGGFIRRLLRRKPA